ncbi:response regulator [Candidatus Dojkabacteria bacterium]|uniref:Response regulator n=1 Tax=Candidatus Dojkabacteria bacterium TaxID=2099670 RepID=A0A3M0Z440_9BACT|nr:MAG: response regulator [Candidatus Dojkabacteria bacterium]
MQLLYSDDDRQQLSSNISDISNHDSYDSGGVVAKKYKILMVEDEDDPRIVFKSILELNTSFEVLTANDGVSCLEILEQNKDIDLVLLDIVMPTKDGIQTLTEIVQSPERYGKPKVVMLSNLGGEIAFETAKKLGAIDFWMKIDTDPEQLLKKTQSILTSTNYESGLDNDKRVI